MKIQEMHIQNWPYNLLCAGAEEKCDRGDVYTKSWSGADEAMQLSGT